MGLRLFAAVVPPPDIVAFLIDRAGEWDLRGKPIPIHDWHITVRFVGTVDDVTHDRWMSHLDQDVGSGPFQIALTSAGAFPRPGRATVAWVGVDSPGLISLAGEVEEAAVAAGIAAEERPYRPHLTLARLRPPVDVSGWVDSTPSLGVSWMVSEFHVMAAIDGRYRILESFPLAI